MHVVLRGVSFGGVLVSGAAYTLCTSRGHSDSHAREPLHASDTGRHLQIGIEKVKGVLAHISLFLGWCIYMYNMQNNSYLQSCHSRVKLTHLGPNNWLVKEGLLR